MTEVVLVDRLGDINFGLPEDLAPHKKPWAYYELLGIARDASPQEIKKAVKRLTKKHHPDKFAAQGAEARARAEEHQRLIHNIRDVLLDDGGEIGEEWSRHQLYDKISGYGDFFGAVHIEYKGERTVTIAENLLDLLELEKRGAESEYRFKTEHPEVTEDIKGLEEAIEKRDRHSARQYHKRIIDALAAKEGVTPAKFERKQKETTEKDKKRARERNQKNCKFAKGLLDELALRQRQAWRLSELKQERTPLDSATEVETHKVFDIWYNGEKGRRATVTFGTSYYNQYSSCSVVGYDESDRIITMGLKDRLALRGVRKVHFKAQHANVLITDAHLEGIFQIVNGIVTVAYKKSLYSGAVIRARAPKIKMIPDFVQHGDLYVPKSFATEGWEEREPKVDIAVVNGTVRLGYDITDHSTPWDHRPW